MTRITQDLKSKLIDGVLVSVVMVLISVLIVLMVRPLELQFSKPGLMVYTIALLAIGMLSLERSIAARYSEISQAAWGLAGGLVTWSVIELGSILNDEVLASERGIIFLMLISLVVGILWRKVLPVGPKFFVAAVLAAWASHLWIYSQSILTKMDGSLEMVSQISGFVAAGVFVLTLAWIFFETRTRMQRLWGSLILWLCVIMVIYAFRGGLY